MLKNIHSSLLNICTNNLPLGVIDRKYVKIWKWKYNLLLCFRSMVWVWVFIFCVVGQPTPAFPIDIHWSDTDIAKCFFQSTKHGEKTWVSPVKSLRHYRSRLCDTIKRFKPSKTRGIDLSNKARTKAQRPWVQPERVWLISWFHTLIWHFYHAPLSIDTQGVKTPSLPILASIADS